MYNKLHINNYKSNKNIMTTKEEMMDKYVAQLKDMGESVNEELLAWCFDRVGPANYKADAQLVACSDEDERGRVYKGFVGDELKEKDEEKGMKAIAGVCEKMSGINRKYRAVVYYLLAKKYGK